MDIKAYIASGILEGYVLNGISDQERREVECMADIYPEIRNELIKLQSGIEKFAEAQAKPPPQELKSKLLTAIEDVEQEKEEVIPTILPINQNPVRESGKSLFIKIAIAAGVCLLIGAGTVWFYFNDQMSGFEQRVSDLEDKNQSLTTENNILSGSVDSLNQSVIESQDLLAELSRFDTKKIGLAGTDKSPDSKVNVFWNTASKNVYLSVENLPEHGDEKQYQLWAIVDGVPSDMGVFDLSADSESTVQKMPYGVESAQAFAITLEPKGGSEIPTLSEMYVVGNVL